MSLTLLVLQLRRVKGVSVADGDLRSKALLDEGIVGFFLNLGLDVAGFGGNNFRFGQRLFHDYNFQIGS